MPSLTEELPEYPEKVQEFLKKRGYRRLPYGFIVAHGSMVATTTTEQRRERCYLGETAIRILAEIGVSEADLKILDSMADNPAVTDKQLATAAQYVATKKPPATAAGDPAPDAPAP
jgi:hypothetical protein